MQINLQVVVSIWLLWLFVTYEETFRFRVYYWLSTFKFLVFFSVFLFSRTISSFDSHIMSKQRALFQWTWEFLWLVFALFCFDLLHLIHSYFCLTCWNLCIAGLKQFTGVKNSYLLYTWKSTRLDHPFVIFLYHTTCQIVWTRVKVRNN